MERPVRLVPDVRADDLEQLAEDWRISLRAQNRSAVTIKGYLEAVRLYKAFALERGLPTTASQVRRRHIQEFLDDQLQRWTPGTARNRHGGLLQYFRWCHEEGEIAADPMDGLKPPKVPENPVPVIPVEHIRKLLQACEGSAFESRRDAAIVRVLLDTGVRRAELTNLNVADVDLYSATLQIRRGKGGRARVVPIGARTTETLRKYMRARRDHTHATDDALWLGVFGPLTQSGHVQMLKRRFGQAGVPVRGLHTFRHTAAHLYLRAGMQEHDLMRVFGWSSSQMVSRYGASAAAERALEAGRSMSPMDRL